MRRRWYPESKFRIKFFPSRIYLLQTQYLHGYKSQHNKTKKATKKGFKRIQRGRRNLMKYRRYDFYQQFQFTVRWHSNASVSAI